MQSAFTFAFVLFLIVAISEAAPITSSKDITGTPVSQAAVINSFTDITGEPVRQKRANRDYYQGDYFICYPSSVVYGQRKASAPANRRSDNSISGVSAFDSFEARKDRADRERAAYTDSYGK